MSGNSRLAENLQTFAALAKRVVPDCNNEEQTKTSLINPLSGNPWIRVA